MADRTGTFYPVADDAIHGDGAELQMGNGASPEVFEAIAGVLTITPGEMTTADIDTTHLRSPDAHREHRAGIRDSGAIQVTGVLLPNEQSQSNTGGGTGPFQAGGLISKWRGRANHNFKIVFAEGSPNNEWPFRAYVSQFQPGEIGVDDKVNFTASFMPNQAYDADLP
jgi:hypothetical protein